MFSGGIERDKYHDIGYWEVLKNFLQDYIETFFGFSVFVKFVILRGLLQILSC